MYRSLECADLERLLLDVVAKYTLSSPVNWFMHKLLIRAQDALVRVRMARSAMFEKSPYTKLMSSCTDFTVMSSSNVM